jgi:hypothetical protein
VSIGLIVTGCGTAPIGARTSVRAATISSTTERSLPLTTTTTALEHAPLPTLVYAGPGVALIGIGPGNGYEGTEPPHLFLSTDALHWADVTPPRSLGAQSFGYGVFTHASFLDASTGWVTEWGGPASTEVTIYRTRDEGKTWSSVSGGDVNIGDVLIQVLSPSTAIRETLQPTGPVMSLDVSENAGDSWTTVYTGPPGVETGQRLQGPFETPIVFSDVDHAFASEGDPLDAGEPEDGDFFYSSDGGATWTHERAPLPRVSAACPSGVGETSSTSCMFAPATFYGTRLGVLPGIVTSGTHANVGFDTTADGGLQWSLQSQRSVTVTPDGAQSAPFVYPLVSVSSPSSWWVAGWTSTGITTQVTGDGGASWSVRTAHLDSGGPAALAALSSDTAILSVETDTPDGAAGEVLVTTDAGRTWDPVATGK